MYTNPKKICAIAGDSVADEFFWPIVDTIEAMNLSLEWVKPVLEGDMPGWIPLSAVKGAIDGCDATIYGFSKKYEGIFTYLKWGKRTYAHIRPVKHIPGCPSPLKNAEKIDYIIVRENMESMYPGLEGDIKELAGLTIRDWKMNLPLDVSKEGKYALKIITVENTKNIAHYACKVALKRKKNGFPGKVTCATKSIMLKLSDGLFRSIVEETVKQYPELSYEHFSIDDISHQLVSRPKNFDVIVVPNMYGDILGDIGAATVGGLETAPRAAIGDSYAYFDSLLQTQASICGKNIVNPTGMYLSAAMMLEYLGFEKEAVKWENAIRAIYSEGKYLTKDKGGNASTSDFCKAAKEKILGSDSNNYS